MTKIKTYKEYKQYAIKKLIEKKIIFSFDKVDDRFHYIYRITNKVTGIHYYGSKTSTSLDIGIKYFTSSKDKEFKKDFKTNTKDYKIKILKIFDNSAEKIIYESYLHQYFNVKKSKKFYNNSNQTPTGFCATGMVYCKNIINNEFLYITKEEFDNNPNLVGISKGIPKTLEHNKKNSESRKGFKQSKETKEKLSLKNKGKVNVIDKEGNSFQTTLEEYKNNPDLVHVSKGLVTCKDTDGNTFCVTKEEFDSRDDLFGINKGMKHTENTKNKIKQTKKDNPQVITNETRTKLSNSNKDMITCLDTRNNTTIRIHKDLYNEKEYYINLFKDKTHSKETKEKIRNKTLSFEKIICTYCNKEFDIRNYSRWHGENCKLNKI